MANKKLSRDQKRKAKLSERDKKARQVEDFKPYEGSKYQADQWVPVVNATEKAIYQTILESKRTLTNAQVRQGLILLIDHLRRGGPAAVGDGEAPDDSTAIVERLFYNVRQSWRSLADNGLHVASVDLIGVLRTLLKSMEIHALRLGESRGYVAFLEDFLSQTS